MSNSEYRHGTALSIRDYAIKQDGIYEGQLTITIDFSTMDFSSELFISDKYTDFLREVAEIVKKWNGDEYVCVTGKAAPERTTIRHEVSLSPASVAALNAYNSGFEEFLKTVKPVKFEGLGATSTN